MLKKNKLAISFLWIMILILLPAPLVYLLAKNLVDTKENVIIYGLGVLAYFWWLVSVYLSTRPKWIEKEIGLPQMYLFHGVLGIFSLAFAMAHKLLAFSIDETIKDVGNWALYLALFSILYAIFFLSGWVVDRFPITKNIKNKCQFVLKHQVSVWIHRLNFVIIGLIWLHVHLIGRITSIRSFIILFDLYTIVILAKYIQYKFIETHLEKYHGQLVENHPLDKETQKIVIRLGKKVAPYKAGDIFFLRFKKNAAISQAAHPFSVSSAPSYSRKQVQFTIQRLGDYTKKISEVPLGSQVYLEGPFGMLDEIVQFSIQKKQSVVLYGLGSGIAPLLSLALEYGNSCSMHVIWSIHQDATPYYHQEFLKLQEENSRFQYDVKKSRYTLEDLTSIIDKSEIEHAKFIIVGSASVVLKVESNLKKLGVTKKQIVDERLTM